MHLAHDAITLFGWYAVRFATDVTIESGTLTITGTLESPAFRICTYVCDVSFYVFVAFNTAHDVSFRACYLHSL